VTLATQARQQPGGPCPGCENEKTQVFHIAEMDCVTEVALVEGRLKALAGVCSVRASALTRRATVVHTLEPGAIEQALRGVGLQASEAVERPERSSLTTPTLAAAALTTAGFGASAFAPALATWLFAAGILAGGVPIARKGFERARQRILDMNVLMTLAVVGAMAIGDWAEGASTVALFSLAQLLEARSLDRARKAIAGLMTLAPEEARVRRDAAESRVAATAVLTGETILVSPGERVPMDGLVEEGVSELDQSPLTGESQPVTKRTGDEVFAGSINGSGLLAVRVTRAAAETTLSRLIRRVEEAQASRAPSQGFVDRFARVYTPAVVALAAAVATLPPLLGTGTFGDWFYRALVLLVIACPCALVISTPVSIVSALTAASCRGVLIKGGAHLEALGRIRAIAFDKTGTLTEGRLVVTDVQPAPGIAADELVALAAALELRSVHPLGDAIAAFARERRIPTGASSSVTALPGRGIRGRVNGCDVIVGSHRLFDEERMCDHRLDADLARLEGEGKTAVMVGDKARGLLGVLAVADAVRRDAAAAVAELQREGLEVTMLTGDNRGTAEAIARQVGIAEWSAGLLPEDKVARIRALHEAGEVAMVGDGVNDAPALAAASVGIAMGGRGTDAALETADVVLLSDDLRRITGSVRLGRRTRRVVRQNVALALAVKAAVLVVALAGHGSLWAAVAADMGASLLVIGNGLRLLRPTAFEA
jgi:Cd2+/Zn2+-exporting ATPase